MMSKDAPKEIPLELKGGTATADLMVTGPLKTPAISGKCTPRPVRGADHERSTVLRADVVGIESEIEGAEHAELTKALCGYPASPATGLAEWRLTIEPDQRNLKLRGVDLKQFAKPNRGRNLPMLREL